MQNSSSSSNTNNMQRIALVTGANKGIGYCIVKQLAKKDSNLLILLGSRDKQRGDEAIQKLKEEENLDNVRCCQLDIDNEDSIKQTKKAIAEEFGGLDILINNAGIAFKGNAWNEDVARTTINTNYYGTLHMCEQFLPLIKSHGRVVFVASRSGLLSKLQSNSLRQQFENENITILQLNELMNKFINDVKNDEWEKEGWPNNTYGVSKLGMNTLLRILARQEASNSTREGVLLNSCCPGWCRTDMAGSAAPRTADQGAEVAVWLATLPQGDQHSGRFWADNKEIDF